MKYGVQRQYCDATLLLYVRRWSATSPHSRLERRLLKLTPLPGEPLDSVSAQTNVSRWHPIRLKVPRVEPAVVLGVEIRIHLVRVTPTVRTIGTVQVQSCADGWTRSKAASQRMVGSQATLEQERQAQNCHHKPVRSKHLLPPTCKTEAAKLKMYSMRIAGCQKATPRKSPIAPQSMRNGKLETGSGPANRG